MEDGVVYTSSLVNLRQRLLSEEMLLGHSHKTKNMYISYPCAHCPQFLQRMLSEDVLVIVTTLKITYISYIYVHTTKNVFNESSTKMN